jgi:hypothetical protein
LRAIGSPIVPPAPSTAIVSGPIIAPEVPTQPTPENAAGEPLPIEIDEMVRGSIVDENAQLAEVPVDKFHELVDLGGDRRMSTRSASTAAPASASSRHALSGGVASVSDADARACVDEPLLDHGRCRVRLR